MYEPKHFRFDFNNGKNILVVWVDDCGGLGSCSMCNIDDIPKLKLTPDFYREFYSIHKCCDYVNKKGYIYI